jgi:hypothetical protein
MPSTNIIFLHCQSFSRKPNAVGQCVAQVICEGLRSGEYHPHVETPKPPIPVFGDPGEFQQLHDNHVAKRKTCATKNGRVSERSIRADRHTLFTIVASYPMPTDAVEASPDEIERFNRWANLTVDWVRERYGNQLKVALAHTDEKHPHLHFWLLPDDPSADATLLHPGKVAKREIEARLKSEGTPPREAVAAGNRALKSAMREWQDSYHRAVGAPLGMRRDGPKRRRLSRGQFQAEQAMLDHHRKLEEDRARLEAQVATLEKQAVAMVADQHSFGERAAAFLAQAERHHKRMRQEAAQVNALGPLLDALVSEIEDRTITHNPEAGWRMRDPAPFRAAGKVWVRLEPAIRRLVGMVQSAEDGQWTVMSKEPEYPPLPRPEPTPFETAL